MEKRILQRLNEIQDEDVRAKAIANYYSADAGWLSIRPKGALNLPTAISDGFDWNETPEGIEYWYRTCKLLSSPREAEVYNDRAEQTETDQVYPPKEPYYKGKGEHSVNSLESLLSGYKEYCGYLNSMTIPALRAKVEELTLKLQNEQIEHHVCNSICEAVREALETPEGESVIDHAKAIRYKAIQADRLFNEKQDQSRTIREQEAHAANLSALLKEAVEIIKDAKNALHDTDNPISAAIDRSESERRIVMWDSLKRHASNVAFSAAAFLNKVNQLK